jgi:hypothetical protein
MVITINPGIKPACCLRGGFSQTVFEVPWEFGTYLLEAFSWSDPII